MLGARTKTIASYGRRGHRIVAVSDERRDKDQSTGAPGLSHSASRSDVGKEKSSSYSGSVPSSRESTPPSSPEYKPQRLSSVAKDEKVAKAKNIGKSLSGRKPLSSVSANVPSATSAGPSTSLVTKAGPRKPKPKVVAGKSSTPLRAHVSLKPISPVVNVEIIVLNDDGKQIKVEKRTTKPAVPTNRVKQDMKPRKRKPEAKQTNAVTNVNLLSDSEDDAPAPSPVRRRSKPPPHRRVVESSSSDDSDVEVISESPPPRLRSPTKRRNNVILSSPESVASTSRISAPVKPPTSSRSRPSNADPALLPCKTTEPPGFSHLNNATHKAQRASIAQPFQRPVELQAPARSKPRPLTPIRSRAAFPAPPSPPSPASDSDIDASLAFDLSELALSPNTLREFTAAGLSWEVPAPPAHLKPLLQECGQASPHEFSAFIEMFPCDPLVQTSHDGVDIRPGGARARPAFRKIGEASYSEVFGIGDVVLKIVPLRNEEGRSVDEAECPSPSDAKDVLKEIIVTRAMGDMCSGFTELLRSYVVRGKYPSLLLDLWDEYHERKGSESIRPGKPQRSVSLSAI